MTNSSNEGGAITTNATEIKRFIRDYYEQVYINQLNNLEEMDEFTYTHNLLTWNHEVIKKIGINLYLCKEIKSVIKNLPTGVPTLAQWAKKQTAVAQITMEM